MGRIIEAGHFYPQSGMAYEEKKSWDLIEQIRSKRDKSMLYLDDTKSAPPFEMDRIIVPIHIDTSSLGKKISNYAMSIITQVNKNEKVTVDYPTEIIKPDFIFLESEMKEYTDIVLEILFKLSKKKGKPRRKTNGEIFCSGGKIMQEGGEQPTCAGYELGLTYVKDNELGFEEAINILPKGYKKHQELVKKIYRKINPEFDLQQHYI